MSLLECSEAKQQAHRVDSGKTWLRRMLVSLPGARAWLWQCYLNVSVSSHNTPVFSVKHLFLLQFGVNHLQSRI